MNESLNIPWDIIAPILIIQALLMIIAWVDLFRAEQTRGPKWMWFVLILISGMVASIVYFIIGRKQS